jgi:DNA-directed RNA polymerase subunit H (RpoH/RPB5)
MSSTPMGDLFFEIVSMMGMRGYNILPFNFLINNRKMNNRFIETGQLERVVTITDAQLLESLISYRIVNYEIDRNFFTGDKMQFSMVFDHCSNGIRTLVLITNDDSGITSKENLVEFISSYLKTITHHRTGGKSSDFFLRENRVTGVFILPGGVSSFSKTFMDEFSTLEIITEDDIKSRVYDNVLQSHYKIIEQEKKNYFLSEVGFNSNIIPSVNAHDDKTCKILGIKKGSLIVATRSKASEEETLSTSIFIRNVK